MNAGIPHDSIPPLWYPVQRLLVAADGMGYLGQMPSKKFSNDQDHPLRKAERNKAIAESHRQGHAFAAIGREYGLSCERVRQIVARYELGERWKQRI
jgi:Mor family transcriptional regulator